MKKRLLIAAVLLFSLVLGLGVGVFAFSGDNLKNASKGYEHLAFTESSGLVIVTRVSRASFLSSETNSHAARYLFSKGLISL